jgi:ABC-type nitrate/sulfonate/bicarbonate transport system permease component
VRSSRWWLLLAVEVGTTVAILVALWFYTAASTSFAVPAMSDVLRDVKDIWFFDRFWSDVVPTLKRFAEGFGLAVVLGVPLGLLLGMSKFARLFLQPTISLLRAIPAVALIPPLLILLGLGDAMKVFLIVLVCIWPIALNTCDGVLQLDDTMRSTAASYRLSAGERLRLVVLPGVSPRAFAGMRASLALALTLAIASEYIAGTDGVGSFVSRAQQTYDIKAMWAGIVLLGIIGYLVNLLFLAVQRRVLHWQQPGASS